MKRGFHILMFILLVLYGNESVKRFSDVLSGDDGLTLSAIAESVKAINLSDTAGEVGKIEKASMHRGYLYVLAKGRLLRFTEKGENPLEIANGELDDFMIDTQYERIIALRKDAKALYFDISGNLIGELSIEKPKDFIRTSKPVFHGDSIWMVATKKSKEATVEHCLCRMDQYFQITECEKISMPELGRGIVSYATSPTVRFEGDKPYVSYTYSDADDLTRDTLYITRNNLDKTDGEHIMLPFEKAGKFLINSYISDLGDRSFFFYYDTHDNTAHIARGGLTDDFYNTGTVADIRHLEGTNRTYYFSRTSATDDSSTLYLIRIKAFG